ncbi:hypothetical protein ACFL27_28285, partial [candidate division CSSED10-310 bacterium]
MKFLAHQWLQVLLFLLFSSVIGFFIFGTVFSPFLFFPFPQKRVDENQVHLLITEVRQGSIVQLKPLILEPDAQQNVIFQITPGVESIHHFTLSADSSFQCPSVSGSSCSLDESRFTNYTTKVVQNKEETILIVQTHISPPCSGSFFISLSNIDRPIAVRKVEFNTLYRKNLLFFVLLFTFFSPLIISFITSKLLQKPFRSMWMRATLALVGLFPLILSICYPDKDNQVIVVIALFSYFVTNVCLLDRDLLNRFPSVKRKFPHFHHHCRIAAILSILTILTVLITLSWDGRDLLPPDTDESFYLEGSLRSLREFQKGGISAGLHYLPTLYKWKAPLIAIGQL